MADKPGSPATTKASDDASSSKLLQAASSAWQWTQSFVAAGRPGQQSLQNIGGPLKAPGGAVKRGAPPGERDVPNVPEGAEVPEAVSATPVVTAIKSNLSKDDHRVKIRVPYKYLTSYTQGNKHQLSPENVGGIIFPYTPQISYSLKSDYAAQSPLHSNFQLQFFKNSSIGEIAISGKFSVENADDADMYLSTVHLIKALMRMRSGGAAHGDIDSGAPPPICRLDAYGDMMLKNVPVVISSLRVELPDNVDYFKYDESKIVNVNGGNSTVSQSNSIPTLSTIQITCIPMYSRAEMMKFSVTNYLNNTYRGQGYI